MLLYYWNKERWREYTIKALLIGCILLCSSAQLLADSVISVWLVVDTPTTRQWVSEENHPSWSAYWKKVGQEAHLPLILPLFDLEDLSVIQATSDGPVSKGALHQAASRYASEVILLGHVQEQTSAGLWTAHWILILPEEEISWTTQGHSVEEAFSGGAQGLREQLSSQSSKKPAPSQSTSRAPPSALSRCSSQQGFAVVILNISEAQAYAQIMAHLKNVPGMRQVALTQAQKDRVHFCVEMTGGLKAWQEATMMDPHLVLVEGLDSVSTYRWNTGQ